MKKMRMKKITAAVLSAVTLALTLAGCGDKGEGQATPEYVYVPEYYSLPAEVTDMSNVTYYDGKLYFSVYSYEETNIPIVPYTGSASGSDIVVAEATAAPLSAETSNDLATADDSELELLTARAVPVPAPAATQAPSSSDDGDDDSGADETDGQSEGDGDDSGDTSLPDGEFYGYHTISTMKLYKMNIDGTGLEELSGYDGGDIPEGKLGGIYINSMIIDGAGNLWIYENASTYTVDSSGNYNYDEDSSKLRKLDLDGNELAVVDTSKIAEEMGYFYVYNMRADADGNVYISIDSSLIVLNEDNSYFKLDVDGWINEVIQLGDGTVGAMVYENNSNGQVFKRIDTSSKSWGETVTLSGGSIYNTMPGSGDYDFYYNDNSSLFGYDLEANGATSIINWINADINSNNLQSASTLPDGRIFCITSNYNYETYENSYELAILTKRPYSEAEQRTILTMATLYLDWNLRSEIIKFNKTNGIYRIEVTDYSQYNDYSTEGGYNNGLLKLNTEIISGRVPDLIDSANLNIKNYASKGLLEDLYPFIDNDPELSRGDLVESVMKAMEYDGKLLQTSSSFSVQTYMGRSDIVGEEPGWTMEEFQQLIKSLPEGTQGFYYMTKSNMLMTSCIVGMDSYVDWSTGKCSFDSADFVALLEMAESYPDELDWEQLEVGASESEMLQSGKVVLTNFYASDFESIQMYRARFGGAPVTFKGFPTPNRDGAMLSFSGGVSMSSKCSDKDGAWQFMRILMTEEYQTSERMWNFPTNKNALNTMIENAMKVETYTDEEGNEVPVSRGSWGWDDITIEIQPTSQEDVDLIMDLINSVSTTWSYDEELIGIITEESQAYFDGQKTAQETANIIQNRVSTYVNEQR